MVCQEKVAVWHEGVSVWREEVAVGKNKIKKELRHVGLLWVDQKLQQEVPQVLSSATELA